MLNIENLKCGFGKHEILHGISLTIPKGQITAIVGQSGCGKTTFLKTLNRMVEEEGGYLSGTITLEGTDIKSLPKENSEGVLAWFSNSRSLSRTVSKRICLMY